MKLTVLTAALVISTSMTTNAFAHNKVVVVPLNNNSVPIRIYYGSVRAAGSLETGNITSTTRSSEGVYSLNIDGDVGGCALTVTKGSQGGGVSTIYGKINASVPSSGPSITIRTRNNDGNLDDTDFHFTAICPQ